MVRTSDSGPLPVTVRTFWREGNDPMLAWIRNHNDILSVVVPIVGIPVAIALFAIGRIPVWHEDLDGDGFGNPEVRQFALWKPQGFVRNDRDCYDGNADAHPDATRFVDKHRGDGSFDYDCNGTSTKGQTKAGSCSNGTAHDGWDGAVPDCGKQGQWLLDCDRKFRVIKMETVRETQPRTQMCR